MKVKVSPFCLGRQILGYPEQGKYGGFVGPASELEALVESKFDSAVEGDRPYVRIVELVEGRDFPEGKFVTTFAKVWGKRVEIKFEQRRPGEVPVPVTFVHAPRMTARAVSVILYSREEMEREGDAITPDGDWQIVSINGRPTTVGKEPPQPFAMLRNWLSRDPNDDRGIGGSPYAGKDPNEFISELYDSMSYWANFGRAVNMTAD